MREEEKLARDVYRDLYEAWQLPVFQNIADSEQNHMDSILALLERYGIPDPVGDDIPGEFEDAHMASLYTELTELGSNSLEDAITVGLTIEDLDIADLLKLMDESDNQDIDVVYQNLTKGSRNHLRSFFFQLERVGGDYKTQYITEELYERILDSYRETGMPISDPDYRF